MGPTLAWQTRYIQVILLLQLVLQLGWHAVQG